MDLSIIIINWHSKDYLRECLRNLELGTKGLACEILVIDNASYDGAAQMVAAHFPHVVFFQSEVNLGFSGGNNRAARQAKGDFLLFLNPDTLVEESAVTTLVEVLRHLPAAGAVGARLLNTDRTLQTSCVQSFPTILNQVLDCDWLRRRFPRSKLWGMAPLFNESVVPVPVDALSGACFMIRRSVFNQVGGFDDGYFMYSEDIDLSYQVRQAGLECYYVPSAVIVHHGGGSSRKASNKFANVMLRESVYRFLCRHRGWPVAGCFRVFIGLSAVLRLLLATAVWLTHPKTDAKAPLNKWLAIFRWSLGMESWSAKQ